MTFRFHLNSLICRPYNSRISTHLSKSPHTPMRSEIETDEGFTREDLMQELGRLELQALGYMKHGEVPREAD
jgi:hypothetical protein